MQIVQLFNFLFFDPIINLLVFILRVLEASHIPGALGFSIILLTVVIKFLIWPLSQSYMKSAQKMAALKPHLDELKSKHKDDKQAFAKAQLDLYKEHGVNPAGGCLPSLVQLPIIIALYQAILSLFEGGHGLERINGALYIKDWSLVTSPDPGFFGLNLTNRPSEFATVGLFVLLVPIVTAALQFVQSKMMVPKIKKYPSDSPKEKKEKEESEDMMASMQSQMLYMMPLMIGFFAFQFQIGLAIYWNTFTILGIWQQYLISGWGGMEFWVKKVKIG